MLSSSAQSFREEQCQKYNSPTYLDHSGHMKEWIPKYAGVSPRDRCKLFCRARGSSEFKVFESKVTRPGSERRRATRPPLIRPSSCSSR